MLPFNKNGVLLIKSFDHVKKLPARHVAQPS